MDKYKFLENIQEEINHNLLCYSENYLIEKPKKGYEKEWENEKYKSQIIKELIEDEKIRDEENYYAFVLGYDLKNEEYQKGENPECDIVFDECKTLAREFMKSNEYKDTSKTGYEQLINWLGKKEIEEKRNEMEETEPDFKFYEVDE